MNNLSDYKYPEFNEDFEGMMPVSGGGGGGVMYVNMTYTQGSGFAIDKTAAEMKAAIDAGKTLILKLIGDTQMMYMPLVKTWTDETYGDSFEFTLADYGSNNGEIELFIRACTIKGDEMILFDNRPSHDNIIG